MVDNSTETIYNAAKARGVPKETLQRCLTDNNYENKRQGQNTVLSNKEDILVHALQCTAYCGFPQDSNDIKEMVRRFCEKLDREKPFKDGIPRKERLLAFKNHHASNILQRKSELLTETTIDSLYEMLKSLIEDGNIVLDGIYNLDDTGLNTNPIRKKVLIDPKSKDAYLMNSNSGKAKYSVLFCALAIGRYLPLCVVHKRK